MLLIVHAVVQTHDHSGRFQMSRNHPENPSGLVLSFAFHRAVPGQSFATISQKFIKGALVPRAILTMDSPFHWASIKRVTGLLEELLL